MKFLKNEWISNFLKKYLWGMILAILLGTLTLLCAGLLMFSSGYVISRAATKPLNILMIYVPILFVRIFGIARPVLHYIERLTSHNWILRITSDLRRKLYLRLEKNATTLVETYKLGDLLGILDEDIANLQNLYLRTLFPVFIAGALSIALIISAGVFSLFFAFGLTLIFLVLYLIVPYISYKRTFTFDEALKKQRNQLFSELTDDILGLQDWTLSGRKEDFLNIYRQSDENVRLYQEKLFSFARKRALVLQLVFGILVLYLMFWSSGALRSGDAPNFIAAVVLIVFPLFDAYAPLSDAVVETNRYNDSVRRLDALPSEKETERTETINGSDITISNLSFNYPDEDKIIFDNINLKIKSGEKLAILGRSGVGKSTLASLIRGDLLPSAGGLTVGGASPAQANNVENEIGIINQNPYLFRSTLRNNLSLANFEASDEAIWSALEIVGLADMVRALPEQLDTMVDEAGQRFSGGERQRLALARILLSEVKIVILDEPTVSLDPITENQLLALFFEALKDKTILFITHHLLGVMQLERTIFLEKGHIKIDGRPAELLEDSPDFARLYRLDKGV